MTSTEVAAEPLDVDALYGPSESVTLVADLFPAQASPRPSWWPRAKVRALLMDRAAVFAWTSGTGGGVQAVMVRYDPESAEAQQITFRGGRVQGLAVTRGAGCACGARNVRGWIPWGGRMMKVRTTHPTYGLPR